MGHAHDDAHSDDIDHSQRSARRAAVERALGRGVGSVFQPIVDLHSGGVIGVEALTRCDVAPGTSIGELFAHAASVGASGALEGAALRSALRARDDLPDRCFLSVNVGPAALALDEVHAALTERATLEGVVVELTAATRMTASAVEALADCRDRGARIAVPHTGLDIDVLPGLLRLEPDFVKVGERAVGGVAHDNRKLLVVDALRHLAEGLGVGLIAQDIESIEDAAVLRRLGIGIGQGYAFAAPSPDLHVVHGLVPVFGPLDATGTRATVGELVEAAAILTEDDLDTPVSTDPAGPEFEVIVTELREPMALLRRRGATVANVPLTLVAESTLVTDAARAALRRPESARFDPLVCIDRLGCCVGVVRIERLLSTSFELARTTVEGGRRPVEPIGARAPGRRVHRRDPRAFRCPPV